MKTPNERLAQVCLQLYERTDDLMYLDVGQAAYNGSLLLESRHRMEALRRQLEQSQIEYSSMAYLGKNFISGSIIGGM